ncbi:MAG: hypothetical protein AB9836_04670 [Aminipila sp.]
MKAPQLYRAYQIKLKDIVADNYKLTIPNDRLPGYLERQTDNELFGQIRRITGRNWSRDHIVEELIFVELGTKIKKSEVVEEIVYNGFVFNEQQWFCCERSGSMKRNGFASFARADIAFKLDESLTMGMDTYDMQVVYSKWSAYRGLFLSGGHLISGVAI